MYSVKTHVCQQCVPSLTSTTTSTPLCTSRSSRYLSSLCVPIAAPHSSCLRESLEAKGKSLFFLRSVRAMMDTRLPSSFTMGSFPVGREGTEPTLSTIGKGRYFESEILVDKISDSSTNHQLHLSCSSAGFHWLLSMSLQQVPQPSLLSLSSPVSKAK